MFSSFVCMQQTCMFHRYVSVQPMRDPVMTSICQIKRQISIQHTYCVQQVRDGSAHVRCSQPKYSRQACACSGGSYQSSMHAFVQQVHDCSAHVRSSQDQYSWQAQEGAFCSAGVVLSRRIVSVSRGVSVQTAYLEGPGRGLEVRLLLLPHCPKDLL